METVLNIVAFFNVIFFFFFLYFMFRILGFINNSTNLYKKMISRHDAIVTLLSDIRDGKKNYSQAAFEFEEEESNLRNTEAHYCSNCEVEVPFTFKKCPKCGMEFVEL